MLLHLCAVVLSAPPWLTGMGGCRLPFQVLQICLPMQKWIIRRVVVYSHQIFLERGWFLWVPSVSEREKQLSQGADQCTWRLAAALNQWLKEKQGGRRALLGQSDNATLYPIIRELALIKFPHPLFFFLVGFRPWSDRSCGRMHLISRGTRRKEGEWATRERREDGTVYFLSSPIS